MLERQLGPLGAVAVGAHARGPPGRPREERDGLRRAAGPQKVMGDPLRRRVVRGEERGGIGVGTAQSLLGQPGGQLFAHERVPEAVAAARTLEHAGRLGPRRAPRRRASAPASAASSAPVKPSSITASAASSRLAERLEPLEPPRHDLAQPRRHRDLAGGVHRRRQLLREERVARRRALDRAEGAGPQRPAGRPLRDRRERAAVERTERHLHRGAALEQARAHERGRLGERLVAHAGDHEQALAGGAAREMVHERHRCLVGRVQIVDHEHHAALRGGLPQQLGDRREDAMAIHGLLRRPRRAAHRGQQSREGGLCAVG